MGRPVQQGCPRIAGPEQVSGYPVRIEGRGAGQYPDGAIPHIQNDHRPPFAAEPPHRRQLQLRIQREPEVLTTGTLLTGQELASQLAPCRQTIRYRAVQMGIGGRFQTACAEFGITVAHDVGERGPVGVAAKDPVSPSLAEGQHRAAVIQDAPASNPVGGVELTTVVRLHEGQEPRPEQAGQLPGRLIQQHAGKQNSQGDEGDSKGPLGATQVPQLHEAANLHAELEEIDDRAEKRGLQPDAQDWPGIGADDGDEQRGGVRQGHACVRIEQCEPGLDAQDGSAPKWLVDVNESPDAVFSRSRGGLGSKPFGEVSPWDRGRLARIGSVQQNAVVSGTLLAFLILRACPKPAGCRRSQRTGLPAHRLPSRQERQLAWSLQPKERLSNFRLHVLGAMI